MPDYVETTDEGGYVLRKIYRHGTDRKSSERPQRRPSDEYAERSSAPRPSEPSSQPMNKTRQSPRRATSRPIKQPWQVGEHPSDDERALELHGGSAKTEYYRDPRTGRRWSITQGVLQKGDVDSTHDRRDESMRYRGGGYRVTTDAECDWENMRTGSKGKTVTAKEEYRNSHGDRMTIKSSLRVTDHAQPDEPRRRSPGPSQTPRRRRRSGDESRERQ